MRIKAIVTAECFALALLISVISVSSVISSRGIPRLLHLSCESLEELTVGQPIKFLLTYKPGEVFAKEIATADIMVTTKGGLQYDGPLSWHNDFSVQPVCSVLFELSIPDNDTTVLGFSFDLGKYNTRYYRTFISTSDTIAYYNADITNAPGIRKRQEQKHFGRTMPPPTDLDGNPIDRPMTRDEWLFQQLKFRERSPLTDADVQRVVINGKLFMRSRGETKFRLYDSTKTLTETNGQESDTANIQYLLVLDLSDPALRDAVESMVDTLYPSGKTNVFKVMVGAGVLKRIEALNVPVLGVPVKKQLRAR